MLGPYFLPLLSNTRLRLSPTFFLSSFSIKENDNNPESPSGGLGLPGVQEEPSLLCQVNLHCVFEIKNVVAICTFLILNKPVLD
jgi:hypothetical protein